jgi:hypothetical protein
MSENTNQEREFTPEEVAEFIKKRDAHYREQIKFLKVEAEYEELLAKIEESRLRKLKARIESIQIQVAVKDQQEGVGEKTESENPETK